MLTVIGGLIWGVLFADFFEGQMTVATRETPIVWAGIVSSLAHGDLPPKAVPPRVLVQAPPFGWGVVQEAEVG